MRIALRADARRGRRLGGGGADIHDRKLDGGSAARGRAPQGRVPRHARARAAQPARADPQRRARSSAAKDALDPELAWSREVIERQVDQLSRLIDDLLDIARIARGKLALRKERLPLERAIDMALETSRPLHQRRGPQLCRCCCRAERGARRCRSGAAGAGVLEPAQQRRQLHPSATARSRSRRQSKATRSWFACRTTASAFGPRAAAALFEPFSQLDALERALAGRPGHRPVAGAGPRGAARRQRRGAQRRPGPGQRIRRAPAAAACAEPLPRSEARGAASRRRPSPALRVLVADDNRDAADSLQRMLALYGHEVRRRLRRHRRAPARRRRSARRSRCSTSACRARTATRWRAPSAHSRGDGVTLIALTGWGQEDDRRRALRGGLRLPPHQAGRSRRAQRPAGGSGEIIRGQSRKKIGVRALFPATRSFRK